MYFVLENFFSRKVYRFKEQEAASNTGAPNENIAQNHLNIALLNIF